MDGIAAGSFAIPWRGNDSSQGKLNREVLCVHGNGAGDGCRSARRKRITAGRQYYCGNELGSKSWRMAVHEQEWRFACSSGLSEAAPVKLMKGRRQVSRRPAALL